MGPQAPENLLFRPGVAAKPPHLGGKRSSLEGKALQTSQLRNSYSFIRGVVGSPGRASQPPHVRAFFWRLAFACERQTAASCESMISAGGYHSRVAGCAQS